MNSFTSNLHIVLTNASLRFTVTYIDSDALACMSHRKIYNACCAGCKKSKKISENLIVPVFVRRGDRYIYM